MEYRELYHYGIKNMKWGFRRYQNADGTLTPAGKKRYARDAREREFDKYDEATGVHYKSSKKNGRSDLAVDAHRYVKEDMERSKNLADAGVRLSGDMKRISEKNMKNRPKPTMDLSNMTDKEMRDQINRALLERQYADMFAPQTVSRGREYFNKTLDVAGDVLTVTGSALAVALSIKALTGK